MDTLTANGAHHNRIKEVRIKEVRPHGYVIVEDTNTEREFVLLVGTVTRHKLVKFMDREGMTEDAQLVGAILTPEPVSDMHKHLYGWHVERGIK